MTTSSSGTSVLDLAARILTTSAQQARAVRPVPWTVDTTATTTGGAVLYAANGKAVADRTKAEPGDAADLPYLALLGPEFGLALAQWLTAEARTERDLDPDDIQRWPAPTGPAGVSGTRHVSLFADNIARLVVAAAERNGMIP